MLTTSASAVGRYRSTHIHMSCSPSIQDRPVSALDLPLDVWCNSLSFVLFSTNCCERIAPVSSFFLRMPGHVLSWKGASVLLSPQDIEDINGVFRFEQFVPKMQLCSRVFLNFQDTQFGARRLAAQRCFALLARQFSQTTGLFLRNWCLSERHGLPFLAGNLPHLRHLELSGCDQISTYDAIVPVFREHPTLLSLRATFAPRAVAGHAFSSAAPRTLMALGFVNFADSDVLAELLARCKLQHLWLSASGSFTRTMTQVMSTEAQHLTTLSLPSTVSEEQCLAIANSRPTLELICRMRVGSPAFGSGVLANAGFEVLPDSQGVVVRRIGSKAKLAPNHALWAPYTQSHDELLPHECPRRRRSTKLKSVPKPSIELVASEHKTRAAWVASQFNQMRQVATDVHEELAAAVAARRNRQMQWGMGNLPR